MFKPGLYKTPQSAWYYRKPQGSWWMWYYDCSVWGYVFMTDINWSVIPQPSNKLEFLLITGTPFRVPQ